MPESEEMNPFEAVDPEIIASLNSCNRFYLKNVIIQIITQYPEVADTVKEFLVNASANQDNDKINKLLAAANFPCHPEHFRLSDFNPACLSETEQSTYKELSELSFLHNPQKPNVLLHGLADQGREKIAIGLGDACCRAKCRTLFLSYNNFVEIIRTHGLISVSNNAFNELKKASCLIIDNFAGKNVYDEEVLDEMTQLIKFRVDPHKESFVKHKSGSKNPPVPCCPIVTSSFDPVEWTKYMKQPDEKTYDLVRFFYNSYATHLHVDENNAPPTGAE